MNGFKANVWQQSDGCGMGCPLLLLNRNGMFTINVI